MAMGRIDMGSYVFLDNAGRPIPEIKAPRLMPEIKFRGAVVSLLNHAKLGGLPIDPCTRRCCKPHWTSLAKAEVRMCECGMTLGLYRDEEFACKCGLIVESTESEAL